MGAWMSWLILLQLSPVFVHGYDNVGFDGWYQPVPHRPVDIITDVINDLGVRILQQYTAHGNVAFSPTGVGFVLAALYEGSAGRGRQQIADALGLPRDRDITRIGFRDIHRRLRTYLNADGFLGGLTLNHENTKLRPEYEDILRFYGFDLSIPEEETNETTSVPETTSVVASEQPTTEAKTSISDETTTQTTTTVRTVQTPKTASDVPMSTTASVELLETTLSTVDEQDRLTQTTPVLMGDTETTTLSSLVTTLLTETTTRSTSTSALPSSITTSSTDATPTTSEASETSQTTIANSVQFTTTVTSMPNIQSSNTEETLNVPSTTVINTSTSSSISEIPSTLTEGNSESTSTSQTTLPPDQPTETTTIAVSVSESTAAESTDSSTPGASAANVTEASTSSTIPARASSTDGPPADENTVSTDSNNQSISNEIGSTDSPLTTVGGTGSTGQLTTVPSSPMMNRRKRSDRSPRGFFSSYPDEGIWMQDLGIWKPYSTTLNEASVRDSTEISFLVNGCDVSSVTASRYFAVLPFAYFPSLHAVALEFPLDILSKSSFQDPRYNILLMMATDRRDTYRLARDLGGKSLRLLRKQLQATWVRATIPSFMLRGFVTLTSFLQRLGILDVFEPRTADLSPMTPDLGVYARDVQQSIGVNIRNYMKPDRTHSRESTYRPTDPPLIVPLRRDYYRYYHPGFCSVLSTFYCTFPLFPSQHQPLKVT
ncbi:hypothetical protein K0M31_009259 [Melipona bicolor]|uniref:Serpin domain-containing protein n=1 Tax=Melipona bicolor TaxID=60889 RepID=A0AA40FP81_9HYME|nr:hypothetical protein K0M31_009259 [Melipona bicolor]